ncbi:MAG: hypothetical protein AMXMBFR13_24220 [Phycisphaerae bacterium]
MSHGSSFSTPSVLRQAWSLAVGSSLILVLLSRSPALAHDGAVDAPAPRVADAVLHAPSPMPDRVVLTWTGDPTSTQAVTWRTSTDVTKAWAEIAVAQGGPKFREQVRRVDATTQAFRSDLSKCHNHTVEFTELEPGTPYVYRVGDGNNFSEWFQFRTAPAKPRPFCFVYFGDAQTDVRSLWSRVIREAHADAPRAAFMLHAGDLIDRAESDALWGEWFGAGSWLNAMIPVIASPGNHEYASEKGPDGKNRRFLSRHWAAQFAFPRNGPAGLEESAYFIDYQNLRVISLNSNERQDEQVLWLDEVLTNNDREWTAVTFHHPIFSMARDRDNASLRDAWKPVFDKHGVDLVLTGHDHTYGRSKLLVPEQNTSSGTNWRSAPSGTVYVVSVSGPKLYDLDPKPRVEVSRVAEDTQLYQIISIEGSELRYEARTATGQLYDGFTLKKRPGRPNEMIEQVPDLPAYLRQKAH